MTAVQDAIDAGDLRQAHMVLAVGLKLAVDAFIEFGDVPVELFETRELHLEHEAMMLFDPPFESELQFAELLAETLLRELRHLGGRCVPADERLQHRHARDAEDVAGNARELDVGRLEELLQPVALRASALDEFSAVAQEIAQLTDRLRRHEALRDQAVPQQVGNPLAVLHVGLATGHVLDVVRIADDDLEVVLEHSMDRLPVDARRLHADVRAAIFTQPVAQFHQLARLRAEASHLLSWPLVGTADEQAGDNGRLVYVESTTSFDDRFHLNLQGGRVIAAPWYVEKLPCVLPVFGCDKGWYLKRARVSLLLGV